MEIIENINKKNNTTTIEIKKELLLHEDKLRARLMSFINIYDKTKESSFPIRMVLYGYGPVCFDSKLELMARIKELSELLKMQINLGGD